MVILINMKFLNVNIIMGHPVYNKEYYFDKDTNMLEFLKKIKLELDEKRSYDKEDCIRLLKDLGSK